MVVKKTVPVPDSPIMHLAVGLELGQFISPEVFVVPEVS